MRDVGAKAEGEAKEVKATIKYLRITPRKARQVINLVRGKTVENALDLLAFIPKKAASLTKKALESAAANASQANQESDPSEWVIRRAWADEGPRMKRVRPKGRFRRDFFVKKMSHITLVLGPPSNPSS